MNYHVEVTGDQVEKRIFVFDSFEEAKKAYENFYEVEEDLQVVFYVSAFGGNDILTITDEEGNVVYEDNDITGELDCYDFEEEGKFYLELVELSRGTVIDDELEVDNFDSENVGVGDSCIMYEAEDGHIEIGFNGETIGKSTEMRVLDSEGNEVDLERFEELKEVDEDAEDGDISCETKKSEGMMTVSLGGKAEIALASIPAGSFLMGSPKDELKRVFVETQHEVTLTRDFWLGKYPVTQKEYEAVTGKNPSRFEDESSPVTDVSWIQAKAFCEKLNKLCAGQLPAGYRFDLPTEAQWEYACRAGTATSLNSGKDITSKKGMDEVGWYKRNSNRGPHSVGQKKPNAWGLYDMHGNVYEWCRDWYDRYPEGSVTDPKGPEEGLCRVKRGGGWNDSAEFCRSARRDNNDPSNRLNDLGFRLALVPVQ